MQTLVDGQNCRGTDQMAITILRTPYSVHGSSNFGVFDSQFHSPLENTSFFPFTHHLASQHCVSCRPRHVTNKEMIPLRSAILSSTLYPCLQLELPPSTGQDDGAGRQASLGESGRPRLFCQGRPWQACRLWPDGKRHKRLPGCSIWHSIPCILSSPGGSLEPCDAATLGLLLPAGLATNDVRPMVYPVANTLVTLVVSSG